MDRLVLIGAIVTVAVVIIAVTAATIFYFMPWVLPQPDVAVGIVMSDPEIRDAMQGTPTA